MTEKRERKLIKGAVVYLYGNDHPFLVVSSNFINEHSDEIIIVSMSSRHKRMDLKTHTVVNYHDSAVFCENIKLIKKQDIRAIAHIINRQSMKRVNECLKQCLNIK